MASPRGGVRQAVPPPIRPNGGPETLSADKVATGAGPPRAHPGRGPGRIRWFGSAISAA